MLPMLERRRRLLAPFAPLLKAFAAVDRPAGTRLEGDLGRLTALGARHLVHLARLAPAALAAETAPTAFAAIAAVTAALTAEVAAAEVTSPEVIA
jgi:hypothetical protein